MAWPERHVCGCCPAFEGHGPCPGARLSFGEAQPLPGGVHCTPSPSHPHPRAAEAPGGITGYPAPPTGHTGPPEGGSFQMASSKVKFTCCKSSPFTVNGLEAFSTYTA